jgi:hypothetical protein
MILTASEWQAYASTTVTGDDLVACSSWCTAVDAAIKELIAPFVPEPATTTVVLDAPMSDKLLLPVVPARSITSVHVRPDANGDSSLFTSDFALTEYTDFYLPTEPRLGYSKSGILYRRGTKLWGVEVRRVYGRLAPTYTPNIGAVKVVYASGPTSVPEGIKAAAVSAVSLLMQRRKTGAPIQSESWNGESISVAGPFTATGAVTSPDVLALLMPFVSVRIA